MRDNLIFFGIPKWAEEDPKATVKEFLQKHLKLLTDTQLPASEYQHLAEFMRQRIKAAVRIKWDPTEY